MKTISLQMWSNIVCSPKVVEHRRKSSDHKVKLKDNLSKIHGDGIIFGALFSSSGQCLMDMIR